MAHKFGIVIGNGTDGKGLIGCIWVVDGDQGRIATGDKARIERLEIYSHPADVALENLAKDPNGPFELKSLLLDCCPGTKLSSAASYVVFKPQAGAPLKLMSEDGSLAGVNGTLKIVTRLRCPLFFKNAQIQLEFSLDRNAIDAVSGSVRCVEILAFRNKFFWPLTGELRKWTPPSSELGNFLASDNTFEFKDDFISLMDFTPPLVKFDKLFDDVAGLPAPVDAADHHARWSVGFNRFRFVEPAEQTFSNFALPPRIRFGPSSTFVARKWRGTAGGKPRVLPFAWQYEGGFYDQQNDQDYDIRLSTVGADDKSAKLGLQIIWKRRTQPGVGPLHLWNESIARPYIESLDSVKRGTPGSVMPVFGLPGQAFSEPDSIGWTLNFDLIDRSPHEEDVDQGSFSIRFTELAAVASKDATVDCHLPNFKDHHGLGVIRAVRIESPHVKVPQSDNDDKVTFSFAITDYSEKAPAIEGQLSRAGALDLSFSPPCQKASVGYLAVATGYVRATDGGTTVLPFARASGHDVLLDLNIRLDSFAPGGQDPAPPDLYREPNERQSGLLLPYPTASGGSADWMVAGPFVLVCKETSPSYASHSLELRLERDTVTVSQAQSAKAASIDIVVLDFSPLLIGRVQASAKWTDEIGNWSSRTPDEASWELGDLGEGMRLFLPPQSVGEEFLRSYDDPEQLGRETKTIFYTFSPVTRAKLLRSPFAQSFSEAPWNLRRLLGYSGQRMPGAELASLAFELLYGLEIDITAEGLLLAEFGARVGRLPGRLSEHTRINLEDSLNRDFLSDKYGRIRKLQHAQLDALARRLAILEPWNRSTPREQLRLANGIVCEIRTSRSSRPYFNTDRVAQVRLKGGFDWAFESKNIYKEAIGDPRSRSAYLANPQLSALGGSGYQEATYAGGKSKVYASTYLGRTFFYSLERKGRIGCLWNKAKHVIIYERTVADTEQFPSKSVGLPGSRLAWQGRAVVRKVREFVEILEPERSYEDNARFTGCVLAGRFGQKVIPVDSAWGHDIDNGWVVPLFKKCAGPFYKPPAIYLKLAVADKASDGFVWGRICKPQKLVFYTNTNPKTNDDSDTWSAVLGVDFPLCMPESPQDELRLPKNPKDKQKEGVCPVPAGMDRFTYEIDTGGKAVDLLKHRQPNAVEALLSNVTLVRRTAKAFDMRIITGPKAAFLKVNADIERARTGVVSVIDRAQTEIDEAVSDAVTATGLSKKELDSLLDGTRFKEGLARLKGDISGEIDNLTQPFVNAGKALDLLVEQQDELTKAWKGEWTRRLKDWMTTAENAIALEVSIREKQLRQVRAEMTTTLQSAELAVGDVARACEQIAAELEAGVQTVGALCKDARNLLNISDEKEYYIVVARLVRRLEQQVSESRQQLGPYFQKFMTASIPDSSGQIKTIKIASKLDELEKSLLSTRFAQLPSKIHEIEKQLDDYVKAWEAGRDLFKQRFIDDVNGVHKEYEKHKEDFFDPIIGAQFDRVFGNLSKLVTAEDVRKLITKELAVAGVVLTNIDNNYFATAKWAGGRVSEDLEIMVGDFTKVAATVNAEFARYIGRLERAVDALSNGNGLVPYRDLDEVRKELAVMVSHSVEAMRTTVTSYERLIEDKYRRVEYELSRDLKVVEDLGSQKLSLVRAFGKSPIAESMRLSRDKLAYHFDALKEVVDFTPATVLVNGADKLVDELKSLSISLPSMSLGSQFISNLPSGISIGKVLPDFSGVKIAKLLEGVAFPIESSENVRIKHGFDEQTKRVWVKADVVVPVGDVSADGRRALQLFELGPVEVALVSALFEAHSSISVDASGTTSRTMDASISGNWDVKLSGRPLLTFKKTKLEFDSAGRSRFKLESKNVEVHPPLNFIAELLDKCKMDSSSGVTFELTRDPRGIPTGARALLNMALPALQTGAFSISNLSMSAYFAVGVESGDFRMGAGLSLASKNRPFIMTVLFLGGGGWFTVDTSYSTSGSGLSGRVSLGISAGAAFAFNISVARGGVYILFSVELDWAYGGGDGGLKVRLRFSVAGELVILKIVSASVTLALEAEYESGGTLSAKGELDISIKICWCFTLSVKKDVKFKLAGKKAAGPAAIAAQPLPAIAAQPPAAIAAVGVLPMPAGGGNGTGGTAAMAVAAAAAANQIVTKAVDDYFSSFGD